MADRAHTGVPPGWERVARRIRRLYGHEVELREATREDDDVPASLVLYIDDELIGGIEPWWDEEWPAEQVLAEVAETIEEQWAQDHGGGLWGGGLAPPWDNRTD